MKIRILFLMILWCAIFAKGSNPEAIVQLINQETLIQFPESDNCDTICNIKGYEVRIIKDRGEISHIGLNLFTDEMKRSTDKSLLDFVEEALLAKVLNVKNNVYDRLVISKGVLTDFSSLSSQSDYYLNNSNSKSMTIEWPLSDRCVSVTMPLNYDVLSSGSREEIENDFITKIKNFKGSRFSFEPIDTTKLEAYGENKYLYPSRCYQHRLITRNVYLNCEDLNPVIDSESPEEAIANLFIFPMEIADSLPVDLTILKHEYGEKETLTVPLAQLLAACEDDGCEAYWGTEKFEDGVLRGAVFLINRFRGFDHIIKIECTPEEILNKRGAIKASASLFIPTNNVQNLYAPYIKKSEK